jgi:hypothetical protein
MKTQPLLVILACFAASVALIVGSAIALKLTDTPISLVAGVASVLGGDVVALVGKTTVFSPATTENLLTSALSSPEISNPRVMAKQMMAAPAVETEKGTAS